MAGKDLLLKTEFTQNYPTDSVCSKINADIPVADIISIESRRFEPNREFPVIVTVWYRG